MQPSYVTREKSANWLECDFFQKLVRCCQWYHSSSVVQHSVFSYRWLWHLPQQKYAQNALLCFHNNMVKGTRPIVLLHITCQSFCRMLKDYLCCSMKFIFHLSVCVRWVLGRKTSYVNVYKNWYRFSVRHCLKYKNNYKHGNGVSRGWRLNSISSVECATCTEMDRCSGCKMNYLCIDSASRAVYTEGFKLAYPSCPCVFDIYLI